MKTNSPYTFRITNDTKDATEFVVIGHSYSSRFEKNYGNESNIKITSLMPNVSYGEFLAVTEKQPFQVVKTIINSNSSLQLEEEIAIIHNTGKISRKNKFYINDYWMTTRRIEQHSVTKKQKSNLISEHRFLFDGEAKIFFNKILGNTEVTIYLYTN